MFRSGTATSVSLVLAAVAAASALLYAGSHSTISTSTAKSSKMPLVSQPSQDVLNTARQDAATTQAESDLANHAQEVDAAWREALR